MPFYKALAEIYGLNKDEVRGIRFGLKRDEVIGLKTWQIDLYLTLRQHGLTLWHLRTRLSAWSDYFCERDDYSDALIYLMTQCGDKNMSVDMALDEIERLTSSQIFVISCQYKRYMDVISLENPYLSEESSAEDSDESRFDSVLSGVEFKPLSSAYQTLNIFKQDHKTLNIIADDTPDQSSETDHSWGLIMNSGML